MSPSTTTTSSSTVNTGTLIHEPRLPVPPPPVHVLVKTAPTPDSSIVSVLAIDNRVVEFTGSHDSACDPGYVTDGNAYYCPTDDTIYVGKNWISQFPYPVQLAIYAHEDGHSEDPNLGSESQFSAEQYADYQSGKEIRSLHQRGYLTDNDVRIIRSWIASIPSSETHGSGHQRLAAFDSGYNLHI